ncbi:MAG TPA: AmmeMemoRadiSam system protein B [Candidatus Goldiibacteriota bacterium]|nr:AmmeMemoRadiSam system protein B [Candidatus Goldiibacteriota bacterium]
MLREPAFAGMFYEKDPAALRKQVEALVFKKDEKLDAVAVIVPHAGYVYSGKVAAEVFSSVKIPPLIILLGPNHTGDGAPVSVMSEGVWRTPLGDVKINEPIAAEILKKSACCQKDSRAHLREHSLEVQLPLLQALRKNFTIVPIALGEYNSANLRETAAAIASVLKGRDALIVASTDLTHYEDAAQARKKDMAVLEAIEALDADRMVREVAEKEISMCGWMPSFVAIKAAKQLGAKKGVVIRYANSGEASGDFSSVVGYGGAAII